MENMITMVNNRATGVILEVFGRTLALYPSSPKRLTPMNLVSAPATSGMPR